MKKLQKQLLNLLNIHAVSGEEKPVRDYLKPILDSTMDTTHIDDYGNLLGCKKVGSGNGATVLLSAHMDTVRAVVKDREIINNNGIISSSKGALGADDRAGIAIILAVLRNLKRIDFNGTIKVAFSREEEIGCIGSGKINAEWYDDVDLAIVVDRRDSRDIVVGCGMAFCSNEVGNFMTEVGKMVDMDWKCVEGGISDAMTFSYNNINSINLSAGYFNEHTSDEFVIIDNMRDTTRLIIQTLAVINGFYKDFGDVPFENEWVKHWDNRYRGSYYGNYFEDDFYDNDCTDDNSDEDVDVWAESEDDLNGDIFIYELDGMIIIDQNGQKVVTNRKNVRELVKQLKHV